MKRITSFLLVLTLFALLIPAASAAAPKLLFSERFSDYAESGKVPYTVKTTGKDENNTFSIKSDKINAAYLEVSSVKHGKPGLSFNLGSKSKKFIYDFKIKIIETASDIMLSLTDYDAVNSRLISFSRGGVIKAADGVIFEDTAEYSLDEWLSVTLIINTDKSCYEIYLNGEKTGGLRKLPTVNNEKNPVIWAKNIRAIALDTENRTGNNTVFGISKLIAYEADALLSDSELIELSKPEEIGEEVVIPDIDVYSFQNFNEFETGETNFGIGKELKRNFAYIDELPGEEDKSVKLESVCEDNFYVLSSFDQAMKDTFVCDFKVYFHDMKSKATFTLRDPQPLFIDSLVFLTNGEIRDCNNVKLANYNINKWYQFQIIANVAEKTYTVYMDGNKITENNKIGAGLKSVGLVRFHVYPPAVGGSSINIDDWKTYGGSEIIDDETLEKASSGAGSSHFTNMEKLRAVFSNKLAVTENGPYFYANGKRSLFDPLNKNVKAYCENGNLMVPIREICREMKADLNWDGEEFKVTLKYNGKEIYFYENAENYFVNGVEIASAIRSVDGKIFVPFTVLNDLFSGELYFKTEPRIEVAELSDVRLDPGKDGKYINEMNRWLIFDRPSPQNVMELLSERYPNNEHPRILVEPDTFGKIKALVSTDEYYKRAYDSMIKTADAAVDAALLKYEPEKNGGNILEISREMLKRSRNLGMAYNLTGEEKYADALWANLEAVGNFPDWYPAHYLDVGEMALAVAIGYDWGYNRWTKQQRKFLETALEEKALKITLAQYESYNQSGYWIVTDNNWNSVCNGGIGVAALAVGDVMPEIAGKAAHYAFWGIESMMGEFAPDGGWGEGITYWQYGISYLIYFAAALNTALGDDFGLSRAPGMDKTGYSLLHGTGPKGSFNYSDSGTAFYNAPQIFWLSSKLQNPELTRMLMFHRDLYNLGYGVDDLCWFDPEMNRRDIIIDPPNEAVFHGIETSYMRGKYTDVNTVYGAMRGGRGSVNHGQLDSGSFIMDALGERWFLDLGGDSYSLPNYFNQPTRWNYYRNRAEGHNTLVINPDAGADQDPDAVAAVTDFVSKPRGTYSALDLTSTYRDKANSIRRGMLLSDGRTVLTVRDEFDLKAPSELYWFAHTKAVIDISEDGKTAILAIGNKKLLARIDSDLNAGFSVMNASALPSSPRHSGENANSGVQKLTVHINSVQKGYINVRFIPVYTDEPIDFDALQEPSAIDEWKGFIPDGELIPFGADEISVDGEPLADFDTAKRLYKVKYPFGAAEIPKITAKSDKFDIDVTQAETMPGKASVKVTDRENPKHTLTYSVEFIVLPQIGVTPPGSEEIKIASVMASDVPQPENPPKSAIDGDLSTRWAAFGIQWIEFDLGSAYDVTYISLAWMNAASRTYPFEIYTSENGTDYENILSTENSKTTNGLETYQLPKTKARYVRVKAFGNSENEWCSMTEAKIYATHNSMHNS